MSTAGENNDHGPKALVARGIAFLKGWAFPLAAILGGALYAILPSLLSFIGPQPSIDLVEMPRDRGKWVAYNRVALAAVVAGDPKGAVALGKMLTWNTGRKYGVDLRGVKVADILKTLPGPNGGGNLFEYLKRGGRGRLTRTISMRHSEMSGAEHPGVPLRGLDMSDVRMDTGTIENWARSINGKGFMGVNLSGVNLSEADLSGCSLGGADISFSGVRIAADPKVPGKFNGTRMMGVDLTRDKVNGLTLKNCDLKMVSMLPQQLVEIGREARGSGLRGAQLPSVDLVFEDMRGVALQFANLAAVNIGKRQLVQVEASWDGSGLYKAVTKTEADGTAK